MGPVNKKSRSGDDWLPNRRNAMTWTKDDPIQQGM